MSERVSQISEFTLIERLRAALPAEALASASVALGIGDDAAIWQPTPGHVSVITTDALTEGIHFRLDWTDWRSLGFKALAVNLSDIAAMGAKPVLATITLGLTGNELISDLEDFYRGLGDLAAPWSTQNELSDQGVSSDASSPVPHIRRPEQSEGPPREAHQAQRAWMEHTIASDALTHKKPHPGHPAQIIIAGGDIVRSPDGFMISVTAIGEVHAERILRRDGARPGDLVVVSGSLGASAAGMALIQDPERAAQATTADLLIAAHLRPQPRLDLGQQLANFGVSAAMDLSDGLTGDLLKLLAASDVGARIEADQVPALPALRALFPDQWLAFALSGGEDYELLFTIPPDKFEALQQAVAQRGATVTAIGQITAEKDLIYLRNGQPFDPSTSAWDHFRAK